MMCLSHPSRVIWWTHHRVHQNRKQQSVYELDTDTLVTRSFRQCPGKVVYCVTESMCGLSHATRLRFCTLWTAIRWRCSHKQVLPMIFRGELLNQSYLVTERSARCFVCDVLAEDPSRLRTVRLSGWNPTAFTQLYLVGDTNLVVEVTVDVATKGHNVHVYRIDEESIRLVASWSNGWTAQGYLDGQYTAKPFA